MSLWTKPLTSRKMVRAGDLLAVKHQYFFCASSLTWICDFVFFRKGALFRADAALQLHSRHECYHGGVFWASLPSGEGGIWRRCCAGALLIERQCLLVLVVPGEVEGDLFFFKSFCPPARMISDSLESWKTKGKTKQPKAHTRDSNVVWSVLCVNY